MTDEKDKSDDNGELSPDLSHEIENEETNLSEINQDELFDPFEQENEVTTEVSDSTLEPVKLPDTDELDEPNLDDLDSMQFTSPQHEFEDELPPSAPDVNEYDDFAEDSSVKFPSADDLSSPDDDDTLDENTREVSRELLPPQKDIPPSIKNIEAEDEISDTTPHNPMFTPMDSLTEVPHTEDFDENTSGFHELSEATGFSSVVKFRALSAKERFENIQKGIKKYGKKLIETAKSLRHGGHGGGGNGGDGNGPGDEGPSGFQLPGFMRRLDWDKLLKTIFSPENRAFHHAAFLITIFAVTGLYTGKFIGKMISISPKKTVNTRPKPMTPAHRNKGNVYAIVESSNLFNSPLHEPASSGDDNKKPVQQVDPATKNKICRAADKQSTLPITLKNTIVLQDSVKSIASVQFRGQNELMDIREGDIVENSARVGKIDRLKVVLKNLETGECEFIANLDEEEDVSPVSKASGNILSPKQGKKLMDKVKDGSISNEGNKFKIKKTVRDEMLANLDQVLTQARAIQIKNPDGSLAFKMTEVVPGSIYSQLDIKDGDIINSINGKPIKNLNEIMTLFGQIKNIDHFEIGVRRGGQEVNKEYDFE